MRYCKSTIFQANHNSALSVMAALGVVCDTAKVRFFKQITTAKPLRCGLLLLFAILQKYDFSSKSQQKACYDAALECCLRYCKSTIFQANHNWYSLVRRLLFVVCDTAKVRFFKQITTSSSTIGSLARLFAILQKYDFSSKSQPILHCCSCAPGCLRYFKSTIFQANHNNETCVFLALMVVCDTAKVRFFKQITTIMRLLRNAP